MGLRKVNPVNEERRQRNKRMPMEKAPQRHRRTQINKSSNNALSQRKSITRPWTDCLLMIKCDNQGDCVQKMVGLAFGFTILIIIQGFGYFSRDLIPYTYVHVETMTNLWLFEMVSKC